MTRRAVAEALFLFSVVFGPLAFGAVEPWSLALLETSLFLLALVRFWDGDFGHSGIVAKALVPALIALLAIGVIQWFNPRSAFAPRAAWPFTVEPEGTKAALILWSSYASLLLSAPWVLRSRRAARRFAWVVFLLGVFVAVVGISQRGQANVSYYGLRPIRTDTNPFGPYTDSDHAASMMAIGVFIGLGLFTARFKEFKDARNEGRIPDVAAVQLLILFLLGILLVGIVQTKSRGALMSMALAGATVGCLSTSLLADRRHAWAARAILAALILGGLVFVRYDPYWIGRVQGKFDLSSAYRLSMYRSGLRMFRDFPLFGLGLGGAMAAFPAYQSASVQGLVDHVHSDWLELLLQTGVVGFCVYALGLASMMIAAIRSWMGQVHHETRCLAAGAIAAAIAFIIHGFIDFSFQIPANAVLFFAVLSLLGGRGLWEHEHVHETPLRIGFHNLQAGLSVACLALIYLCTRPAIAWAYAYRGNSAAPEEQPRFFAQALPWDANPRYYFRLGAAYLGLAQANPAVKRVLLREALDYSSGALGTEPANLQFRCMQSAILLGLNREEDAHALCAEKL